MPRHDVGFKHITQRETVQRKKDDTDFLHEGNDHR